jgi:CRP-like cAMP-binding protein
MANAQERDYELFKKNRLFVGFEDKEIRTLYNLSCEIRLQPGSFLIREGETGNDLFLIMEGELEVLKADPEEKVDYLMDILTAGDSVGEIAFVDRDVRSASVKAQTEVTVRGISFAALDRLLKESKEYSQLYVPLSKHISHRLRDTSNRSVEALKKEVREARIRVNMGAFLIVIITVLCLFTYSLNGLEYLMRVVPTTSYVALPLTFVMGIFLLILMRYSKISWRGFGLTLTNWKQAVFEGIIFPIPLLALGLLCKWAFIEFKPEYAGHPLFEPFAVFADPQDKTIWDWLALNSIYWIIMVPIQELLVRGALQGLMENFLTGKYRVFFAILVSNLIFSTTHIFFALHFGLIVFIGGIYIGWIYSRTHNLISSCIAHAILGTWALSVLGAYLSKHV